MNNHDLKFYIFLAFITIVYLTWQNYEITKEMLELLDR